MTSLVTNNVDKLSYHIKAHCSEEREKEGWVKSGQIWTFGWMGGGMGGVGGAGMVVQDASLALA